MKYPKWSLVCRGGPNDGSILTGLTADVVIPGYEHTVMIDENGRHVYEYTGQAYQGQIPPIAEKEKRGKRVKIPPSEIYVQEIQSGNLANNTGSNHPSGRCGNGNYYQRQNAQLQSSTDCSVAKPIGN